MRISKFIIGILLCLLPSMLFAQSLTQYEYWFDGKVGSKTTGSLSGSEATISTAVSTDGLSDGIHLFSIRFKQSDGEYSPAYSSFFFKHNPEEGCQIEYWFDGNYSKRATMTLPSSYSDTGETVSLDVLDTKKFPLGFHRLNMRMSTPGKSFSSVYSANVLKLMAGTATTLEYWLDDDYDNRKKLTGSTSGSLIVLDGELDLSKASSGLHRLYYRAVGAKGEVGSAVGEMSVMVKSMYLSKPEDVKLTNYSFWVDNDAPEIQSIPDPTVYKTIRHDMDLRDLTVGEHTLYARFWNSLGGVMSYMQPFKVIAPENPQIVLTAEENGGEVSIGYNTIPDDHAYVLYRKTEGGTPKILSLKGKSYPIEMTWIDTPTKGTYVYYAEGRYTDSKGVERAVVSNEVTVNIAGEQAEDKYGSITGSLTTDNGSLPYSGVTVKMNTSDGKETKVPVDEYGKFIIDKAPAGKDIELTVTGDPNHDYTSTKVNLTKKENQTVLLKGKKKEKEEEETSIVNAYHLKLNSELECAANLKFDIKNLSSTKWKGTIKVTAAEKYQGPTPLESNQIYLGEITDTELAGNESKTFYVPLDKLAGKFGWFSSSKDFYFIFKSNGKYDSRYIYFDEEKPIYTGEYSDKTYSVLQTVEKKSLKTDNIPWTKEESVKLAKILVQLQAVIRGMNGKVGDVEQFRPEVLKAAKTLTGNNNDEQAVREMMEWMKGKSAVEILANPTIGILGESLNLASSITADLPLSLQNKFVSAINTASDAMAYIDGVIALYDFVTADNDYEAFFTAADWICSVASSTNPLYGILMNNYVVVAKSMIKKVLEFGNSIYDSQEGEFLADNILGSGDDYAYATINKRIDFKIGIKNKKGKFFPPSEIIKQIDHVVAKASTDLSDIDIATFRLVEDGDYVALKQTGYQGGGLDTGFPLKQFDLEIHWNNKRVTMVPLTGGDGIKVKKATGTMNASTEKWNKPGCYTITFKSDSNDTDYMADYIYLK